jgi:hypothetical protein
MQTAAFRPPFLFVNQPAISRVSLTTSAMPFRQRR